MFDQAAGGFDITFSQSVPTAAPETARRPQSVTPVVVTQIDTQIDEDMKMFGTPVQMISVVGVLRKFDVQSSKVNCEIQDHTGQLKCILWLDGAKDVPEVAAGDYVKAIGSIRQQEGEKIVMLLKILPIKDCNLIINHLLEAMHARLMAEAHGKKKGINANGNGNDTNMESAMDFDTSNMGFNDIQSKVYNILITSGDGDGGIGRAQIHSKFEPKQKNEVDNALEFLLQEGHAYTTYDSDHFKATSTI